MPVNPDTRPLPHGWVANYDPTHRRWYYVNTLGNPPVSTWVHPADHGTQASPSSAHNLSHVPNQYNAYSGTPGSYVHHEPTAHSSSQHISSHRTHHSPGSSGGGYGSGGGVYGAVRAPGMSYSQSNPRYAQQDPYALGGGYAQQSPPAGYSNYQQNQPQSGIYNNAHMYTGLNDDFTAQIYNQDPENLGLGSTSSSLDPNLARNIYPDSNPPHEPSRNHSYPDIGHGSGYSPSFYQPPHQIPSQNVYGQGSNSGQYQDPNGHGGGYKYSTR